MRRAAQRADVQVAGARALVARRRGDSQAAAQLLQDLVRARRERGDELGALRAELELAELSILRGQPALYARRAIGKPNIPELRKAECC